MLIPCKSRTAKVELRESSKGEGAMSLNEKRNYEEKRLSYLLAVFSSREFNINKFEERYTA